jgi:hypothetical protein
MLLFTWQTLFRVSDVGMNVLFAFIARFLNLLIAMFQLTALRKTVQYLPGNIYAARKFIGGNHDRFVKYASCPRCHQIHPLDDCKVVLPNKSIVLSRCSYVTFPYHPHRKYQQPCNTLLMNIQWYCEFISSSDILLQECNGVTKRTNIASRVS